MKINKDLKKKVGKILKRGIKRIEYIEEILKKSLKKEVKKPRKKIEKAKKKVIKKPGKRIKEIKTLDPSQWNKAKEDWERRFGIKKEKIKTPMPTREEVEEVFGKKEKKEK